MELHKFKRTWHLFKTINSLEPIDTSEILHIIDTSEPLSQPVAAFSVLPNSIAFGLIMLFCQSC